MLDLGDRIEDSIIDFMWPTASAAGASITRATNGTVSVYKSNSTTQSTAGVTDTEDFDSTTGIHHCRIDTSADAFYAPATDYMVVLSGATIDGQTVNHVLACFSIENRNDKADVRKVNGTVPTTPSQIPTIVEAYQAGFDPRRVDLVGAGYVGDFADGSTVRFRFFTTDEAGVGASFGGAAPEFAIYKDGSTTQITAGFTVTQDFDGVPGQHLVAVDLTNANYTAGSDYEAYCVGGTVDGRSVVGRSLGRFSVDNRVSRATLVNTDPNSFQDTAFTSGTLNEIADTVWTRLSTTFPQFARAIACVANGTVSSGATTTTIPTSTVSPSVTVTDQYKGRIMTFADNTTTAALRGQSTDIVTHNSSGVFTVTALTTSPASGDIFTIQ